MESILTVSLRPSLDAIPGIALTLIVCLVVLYRFGAVVLAGGLAAGMLALLACASCPAATIYAAQDAARLHGAARLAVYAGLAFLLAMSMPRAERPRPSAARHGAGGKALSLVAGALVGWVVLTEGVRGYLHWNDTTVLHGARAAGIAVVGSAIAIALASLVLVNTGVLEADAGRSARRCKCAAAIAGVLACYSAISLFVPAPEAARHAPAARHTALAAACLCEGASVAAARCMNRPPLAARLVPVM
ncbi:hypothetical protein BOSP111201_16115 [Bordetella sputigena]|uniref:hypothetical protein n=1 Tax=Bordetella sputigena TaxID=1416810 RepID=UPI0039EDFE04